MRMQSSRLSRKRYQKGSLTEDEAGTRWDIRWREDVILPKGTRPRKDDKVLPSGEVVRRVRKSDWLLKKDFPTKRLAQREFDKRLASVNRDDYRPAPAENFAAFAERWKKTILITHKPSAQASEGSIIKIHLVPAFGQLNLREINAEMLQAWVSAQTLNWKTVRNIVDALRVMWTTAKDWGYVDYDPFRGLRLPQKEKQKTYAYTIEETVAIITALDEPWKTLVRIVAESGVRSGEVAGLRIEDFDPINLTLSVTQSVWNTEIQTVKTPNAIRREPISRELADAIHAHLSTAEKNDDGLIFTNKAGKPLDMLHFLNRIFSPVLTKLGIRAKLKAMGIKRCGLHGFRRMSATEMDKQGVPIKTRLARMGHGELATTMIYTKPIDEASRQFADRMGAMLAPTKEGDSVQ